MNSNNPLAVEPETENDGARSGCSLKLFFKFTSVEAAAQADHEKDLFK